MNRITRIFLCNKFLHKRWLCQNNPVKQHEEILSKLYSLPEAVVKEGNCEIKPGVSKTGEYKNPEYHSYNKWSFYEVQNELEKFRMPPPSALSEKERT